MHASIVSPNLHLFHSAGRLHRAPAAALLLCATALLSSCVGIDSTATINRDGSGTIDLRYLVSKMLVSVGSLEANGSLIPFPVSRQDFDATVRGIEGLTLVSYAQKETQEDLVVDARLAFASPRALASFLDPKGQRATYTEDGGRKTLAIVLASGGPGLDPDVARLVDAAFAPYKVSIVVKLPSPALSTGIGASSAGGTQLAWSSLVPALAKSREKIVWQFSW